MPEEMVPFGTGETYAKTEGQGPDTLFMPVAWGMSHDFYQALLEPVDLPLRIIYFDPQGTGLSTPLPPAWNPAHILDEAEAVRAWSGAGAPIVAGHASGAFLTLAYALDHPEHVGGLLLLNPFASYARVNQLAEPLLEAHPRWPQFRERTRELGRVALSAEDRFRAVFKEQRSLDMVRSGPYFYEMAEAADLASFNPSMADDAAVDLLDELHAIQAPSLVIAGAEDPLCPASEARLIAAELPFVRLVEIPDAGHYPFVEAAAAVRAAVVAFLRDAGLTGEASALPA